MVTERQAEPERNATPPDAALAIPMPMPAQPLRGARSANSPAVRRADVSSTRLNLSAFLVALVAIPYGILVLGIFGPFGDTRSFWLAWTKPIYDASLPLDAPHFVYSPVIALVLRPLGILPFPIFAAGWTGLALATYWWLLRPLAPIPLLAALLACGTFAVNGNVEWALACMVVLGVRYPAVWLFAAFTKVAPFLGFGWYALRGEWRAVAVTAGIGVGLVAVSAAVLPGAWTTWLQMLLSFGSQTQYSGILLPNVPLLPRLPIAAVILWWGAARRNPVVLPVVLMLCQPDLQPWMLGYLAAVPRLWQSQGSQGPPSAASRLSR
jgi:hypothetical protein